MIGRLTIFLLMACLAGPAWAEKQVDSIKKAQALYMESLERFDPVGLSRAAALAKKALDATVAQTNLLQGKALYQLSLLYYYNRETKRAEEIVLEAITRLNFAASVHKDNPEIAAYRIMAVDFVEIALGQSADFARQQAESDRTFLHTGHPTHELTVLTEALAYIYRAEASGKSEDMRQAMHYFRRLHTAFPDNALYKGYYYYALAKTDAQSRHKAATVFVELLRKNPNDTRTAFLRGRL